MIWPNDFRGYRIIEDPRHEEVCGEDWSRVRSPSRARRRRHKYRQNIRPLYKPRDDIIVFGNTMVMHPVTAHRLRKEFLAAERREAELPTA